jgi:ribosomal protein S14
MVNKINRDFKLRKNYIKTYITKNLLKSFIKNPLLSVEERQYLKYKYNYKYKFFYSINRIKNHCLISQNTHSVYKTTKLSRHIFKNMALNGQLPGCI